MLDDTGVLRWAGEVRHGQTLGRFLQLVSKENTAPARGQRPSIRQLPGIRGRPNVVGRGNNGYIRNNDGHTEACTGWLVSHEQHPSGLFSVRRIARRNAEGNVGRADRRGMLPVSDDATRRGPRQSPRTLAVCSHKPGRTHLPAHDRTCLSFRSTLCRDLR